MPKKVPPSALQAMQLMQSKVVLSRIDASQGGTLKTLLTEKTADRDLITEIFVTTISRKPTASELEVGLKALAADRKKGAENLQWALLNSPEFLFNY
jgi:hypothetical protein